jgi:hypothetical protein
MEVLERIKDNFFMSVIEQRSAGSKLKRDLTNLTKAKTFGIIYDSTVPGNDVAATKIAEWLRNKGKEVAVLGFMNDKKITSKEDVEIFNAQDINWYGVPKIDRIKNFCDQDFDVLLCGINDDNRPLEYIAYMSKAKCRIGPYIQDKVGAFELMVNMEKGTPLKATLEKMIVLLNQIKL